MNNRETKKILKATINNNNKLKITMRILIIVLILLVFRLAFLQIVQGEELSRKASVQQTTTKTIQPTRYNL